MYARYPGIHLDLVRGASKGASAATASRLFWCSCGLFGVGFSGTVDPVEIKREVGELAAEQHGLVIRRQLIGLGVSRQTIQRLLDSAYLVPVSRGVYLVGVPRLSHFQLLRASTLLAGEGSRISARAAVEGHGLLRTRTGLVAVTGRGANRPRPQRTQLPLHDGGRGFAYRHVSARLTEAVTIDGVDFDPLERALVDFAANAPEFLVRRAWKEAEFKKKLDIDRLRIELSSNQRSGAAQIRGILTGHRTVVTDATDVRSISEVDFLHLVDCAGLPRPEVNVPLWIGGKRYLADFYWRHLRLVVETDGPQHLTPSAGAADRERDLEFLVDDIDVVRLLTDWLLDKPAWCMTKLEAAMERQRRRLHTRN